MSKLQTHLQLLREEYVKLQSKYVELEKKYQVALASSGRGGEDNSFVAKLLQTVADLFEKEEYRYDYLFTACLTKPCLHPA